MLRAIENYPLTKQQTINFEFLTTVMKRSSKAKNVLARINANTKLGDLRKIAASIKKDHDLAMELWSTGNFFPRLLAILIMDNKLVSDDLIEMFDQDMQTHSFDERNQLMDWFMANQLLKNKKTISPL